MEEHIVKILSINQVTHDVKRFRIEKPDGYSFIPGQATEVSIYTPVPIRVKVFLLQAAQELLHLFPFSEISAQGTRSPATH